MVKLNSFVNPSGSWKKLEKSLGRFLNFVLIQEMFIIAGSLLLETIFSPEEAIRISEYFSSLYWSDFAFRLSPRSVGGCGVEEREEGGGKERKSGQLSKGHSRAAGEKGSGVLALKQLQKSSSGGKKHFLRLCF